MATWLINATQATIDGLIDGGIYAWIGLGLSLSFVTLRRLNLAYGATALFGIYGGLWLHQKWDLPLPVLVVVIVDSSDKVRKYINPANTNAAIAAATELAKMMEINRWDCFMESSNFLWSRLILLYSAVTSVAASAASRAILMLS